jgi:ABC-type transport system involved in multi-copper enzyme maturation permease subunit
MNTLIWKDYRENRKILAVIGILLLIPYVIYLMIGIVIAISARPAPTSIPWAGLFWGASSTAFYISIAVVSFIAGNAIAGERANRSAEFAAYLPIPRRSAIASKAIIAISSCLFFLVINYTINKSAGLAQNLIVGWDWPISPVQLSVITAVLMFGVSWLVSSLSSSSVIAAVSGVAAFLLLSCICVFGTLKQNQATGQISVIWWVKLYAGICLIAGIGCFVAGVICYLRRVEP